MDIKGVSYTTKTDENKALFVRTVTSMFAFMRQKGKHIMSLIVGVGSKFDNHSQEASLLSKQFFDIE